MTETTETEQSDTDRSINLITEIKHLTERKNYITMTTKNEGLEKELIVDTQSTVTKIPPEKEKIKDKKNLPATTKHQDVKKTTLNSPER